MEQVGQTLNVTEAPIALAITVLTSRLVRLRLGERSSASPTSYLPVRDWPSAPFTAERGPPMRLDTGALTIELSRDAGRLSLCDRAGRSQLVIPLRDVALRPRPRLRLEASEGQHFYGLGEGGRGFDRLGATRRLWTRHVNHGPGADVPIPLLLSNRGYGLFFDCSSDGEIGPGDSSGVINLAFAETEPGLDLYYLAGADLREVLGSAAMLLGSAPLPPRWALGFLQSTRHFETAEEMRRLAATMREKQLPCDALIFLSTYGDQRGWNRGVGHLGCEPTLLAQPEALFAELRAQHFHVITHEYPVVHQSSPLHAEAKENGYLLDAGYPDLRPSDPGIVNYKEGQRYIDFSRPEARAWWWERHGELARLGVAGWWLDGGEGPPAETRLHAGAGVDLHNRYDLLRQQAFAEGEARDRPEQRAFLLCRSGGAGMQRFGAACWSGDINNTFATLEAQIPAGLSMALSGVPLWGTDIGGFYAMAPIDRELFARWFQFGAFCPVFRAHGRVWRMHLPWSHGPEIEAICRRYLELRYRLMPYTYTLAWQAHRAGLPLMRPLILNYPEDPRVWELGSQYLWGDDLLVAPVTRTGATHWPVYLPEGRWFDFWTHEAHDGPGGITIAAPLERLPLLVREGAIIPMGPAVQHLAPGAATELTLLTYPAGRSTFTLYDDDGTTTAYRRGGFALTEIECVTEARTVTYRIGAPRGDAATLTAQRSYTLQIRASTAPRSVTLDGIGALARGEDGMGPGWWHDGRAFLFVRVGRHPATLRIEW